MRRAAALAMLLLLLLICPHPIAIDHLPGAKISPPERVIMMTVTAYTSSVLDCGNDRGITATGSRAGPGTISADWRLYKPGVRMFVPGYGWGTVRDKGGAVRNNRLDIWMPSEAACRRWALKRLEVEVLK